MRHALALAALLAATAAQAQPSDMTLVAPERENRPAVVAIHGHLNDGDENKFHNVTSGLKHAVVFLDFAGGHLGAAADIGTDIRTRNFQTAVVDHAICSSACALIWLAGTTRYLGTDSRIGFHSASIKFYDERKMPQRKRSEDANARVAIYLDYLGYPKPLAHYVAEVDPQSFTWLSPSDATKFKINPHPLSELGDLPLAFFPPAFFVFDRKPSNNKADRP